MQSNWSGKFKSCNGGLRLLIEMVTGRLIIILVGIRKMCHLLRAGRIHSRIGLYKPKPFIIKMLESDNICYLNHKKINVKNPIPSNPISTTQIWSQTILKEMSVQSFKVDTFTSPHLIATRLMTMAHWESNTLTVL